MITTEKHHDGTTVSIPDHEDYIGWYKSMTEQAAQILLEEYDIEQYSSTYYEEADEPPIYITTGYSPKIAQVVEYRFQGVWDTED